MPKPALSKLHEFGGAHWRYCVPGAGVISWREILEKLKDRGYEGCVSIELEDEDFNGSEAGEKRGLLKSRDFLEQC